MDSLSAAATPNTPNARRRALPVEVFADLENLHDELRDLTLRRVSERHRSVAETHVEKQPLIEGHRTVESSRTVAWSRTIERSRTTDGSRTVEEYRSVERSRLIEEPIAVEKPLAIEWSRTGEVPLAIEWSRTAAPSVSEVSGLAEDPTTIEWSRTGEMPLPIEWSRTAPSTDELRGSVEVLARPAELAESDGTIDLRVQSAGGAYLASELLTASNELPTQPAAIPAGWSVGGISEPKSRWHPGRIFGQMRSRLRATRRAWRPSERRNQRRHRRDNRRYSDQLY